MNDFRIEQADYQQFLRTLHDNSVDLILTDPPYAISRDTGFASLGKNSVERLGVSMDFGEWDHQEIDINAMSSAFHRVVRKGGTVILWYDIWKIESLKAALEQAGFRMIRLLIWSKTNPVPLNSKSTYLSNGREVAVSAVKGSSPTFNSEYDTGDYAFPIPRHGGERLHPTQKPLNLFCDLVVKHSNMGDLVVDPFLGSGTTALAAMDTFRRFAGCDISEKYANIALKRVNDEYRGRAF